MITINYAHQSPWNSECGWRWNCQSTLPCSGKPGIPVMRSEGATEPGKLTCWVWGITSWSSESTTPKSGVENWEEESESALNQPQQKQAVSRRARWSFWGCETQCCRDLNFIWMWKTTICRNSKLNIWWELIRVAVQFSSLVYFQSRARDLGSLSSSWRSPSS